MNFFKRLFRQKEIRFSKIDYWKKWELFQLFDDLHEAEDLLNSRQTKADSVVDNFKETFIEVFAQTV